jgi:hypothetical protein
VKVDGDRGIVEVTKRPKEPVPEEQTCRTS